MTTRQTEGGYTLLEVLVSLTIAALLLSGLQQLLSTGIAAKDVVAERTKLVRGARFAMARMVDAVRASDRLMIPLSNNPATTFDENLREQTVPPSPPQAGSTLATAVLAVTIDPTLDIDANGVADADNDGDGLVDEDLPADTQNDGKAGIRDFDDDGNGTKDFFLSPAADDDESNNLARDEDAFNGIDDDGDGIVDEDPGSDNNGDGCPGICAVDDDGDGNIDEGNPDNDDEDSLTDEDWYDPVVFYLQGSSLIERRAVPWDENTDGDVNGRDFVESTLIEDVTLLRFERLAASSGQQQLVDITLQIASVDEETINLNTRVRLGASR